MKNLFNMAGIKACQCDESKEMVLLNRACQFYKRRYSHKSDDKKNSFNIIVDRYGFPSVGVGDATRCE